MEISWAGIAGHEARRKMLCEMAKREKLPHAMLFYGPRGVGKKRIARVLAAALLCEGEEKPCGVCASCMALKRGVHPDYFEVCPEGAGKAAKSIRIDKVREISAHTLCVPQLSRARVTLIDDAELMNEAAANSLLKTLEEPAGAAFFLLITGARAALLPTIISRTMPLSFGYLEEAAVAQILRKEGVEAAKAQSIAALSEGRAERAFQLLDAEGIALLDDALTFLETLSALGTDAIFSRGKAMGEWQKEKLLLWLSELKALLRDLLLLSEGGADITHKGQEDRLIRLLGAASPPVWLAQLKLASEQQRRLSANLNLRLFVEAFLIRMRDIHTA